MESNELYFGLLLGLLAVAIGIGVTVGDGVSGGSTPSRTESSTSVVADSSVHEDYSQLAALTREHLAARTRSEGVSRLVARIGSYGGVYPDPLAGILFLRQGRASVASVLRSYHDHPDFMEGPPFHLVADETGKLHTTRRWRDGRPWRLAHEPIPDGWVVVCLLGCELTDGELPLLVELLEAQSTSILRFGWTPDLLTPMTTIEKLR